MNKVFVILSAACLIAPAFAGVRELSPSEESQALQLFSQICGSGQEQGTGYGDTYVYCKRARGDLQETLNHQVSVGGPSGGPAQVVFVQPPPVKYYHRVNIVGSGAQGQQAKIYVLPQKATHEVQANYQGGGTQVQKPVVYFLKGNSGNSGYPDNGGNNGNNGNTGSSYGPPREIVVQPSYRAPGYN